MKILSPQTLDTHFPKPADPKNWTVVIPAAGRGSRLGFTKSKILYPIAGRPILDWLIDLLEPQIQHFIFVLSPTGQKEVGPLLKKRLVGRFQIAIQQEPRGMADAINQALPRLATPQTLIIWGDQVAIQPKTIERLLKIQEHSLSTKLSLPIVEKSEPYVHYETDAHGQLQKILARREGDIMPPTGRSDCGLFALDTKALKKIFFEEIKRGITPSAGTKEWNFLPMLPAFELGRDSVIGLQMESLAETIGVNDTTDVAALEAYFKQELANG